MALTAISTWATYHSAIVIDEIYLNNQRANLAFDEYFKTNSFGSVKKINEQEIFYLPSFLNKKRCSFIRYGEREVQDVISSQKKKAESVLLQLQKPERKFTYHVSFLSNNKQKLSMVMNNSRPYQIHLNLEKEMTPMEIIESYYFARVLDINL